MYVLFILLPDNVDKLRKRADQFQKQKQSAGVEAGAVVTQAGAW